MTAETSGATTSLVVDYVRRHGGEAAVAEVVRRSGVPHTAAELADVSRWVSYTARIRLFEAATEVLGDPEATRRIGETALHAGLHHALVLVLRALGSPRQVYRSLPRAVPKFTTTSTMEVLESGRTSATLRYRLHEGYRHSRLDCAYAQGLITVVPELFGLPRATLVHDECESDGAPACVYRLTWDGRRRLPGPGRRSGDRAELAALRGQLAELQSAATDLVASEDVTAVLRRITERAATSVLAPAYLLAVHDPDGGPPLVQSRGLAPERAAELAARLLAGDDLGPGAVVVDVASSRRPHGRLAALHADGQRGPADESRLLAAYAGHAAAALDLLVALERSRRGEARAAALLGLARALRASTDAETVGRVVAAALPRIVGSERASVLLWEPASGCLRPVAVEGLPEPRRSAYLSALLRVDEIPELVTMLTRREPTRVTLATATPALAALMTAIGVEDFVCAPLVAGGRLLGVTTTGWSGPPPDLDAVLGQLQAVAEYAATALENARLLETVRHQAHHDALTGLPNRLLFSRELDAALAAAADGRGVALLFCDLDRFKHVNDLLGHAAGDELLRQVAGRLRGVLRTGDVVARISGDEFALLLPGVSDPDAAEALAHRVVACFQRPFRVEGRELRCTTSVGVALQPGAGGDGDALLRAADDAMYDAKQRGRNQVSRSRRVRDAGAGERATLAADLRRAVPDGELRQVFQPVVLAPPDGTGPLRVVGAEALVRWQHPRLGLLAPAAFLPLAEELGLVADLDLWGVTAACAAAAGWPEGRDGPHEVAVNLAARTLLDDRLLGTVRDALAGSGLAPGRLHLEVVESRALVDLPGVVDRLAEVRQLGARVALDDFGTGYSTLAWLQRLPVDRVKVDRSFTAGVPGDAASLSVVRGVLALARELGVEVVAEGVETPDQLAALRGAGCRLLQGYLLGPPAPGAPRLLESLPEGLAGPR